MRENETKVEIISSSTERFNRVAGLPFVAQLFRSWKVLVSLAVGLAFWEILGQLTSRIILAPFSETLVEFGNVLFSGLLIEHAAISLAELGLGFTIAFVVGTLGGLFAAFNKTFHEMTDPWLSILYSTPYVAFVPLFIVWLGLGMASKAALAVYAAFIPIWLNTYHGISTTDPKLVEVVRCFGASRFQTLKWVNVPWALPSVIVGVRLGLSRAFIAVIVGEFMGATAGIGYMISISGNMFQTERLLAFVAVLGIITLSVVELVKWIQRRAVPWWEERQ